MENYKIEAISDILTRSDLGNTRADFADLVEQFETLKTARNEQAAQLELDLKKTRAEAFALFDSVPYFSEWIAERVQQLELSGDQDYIKENIDFDSILNNYIDKNINLEERIAELIKKLELSGAKEYIDENINLEEMISNKVDFDELVLNNVDCQQLVSNQVDFDELVSNCMDFDALASKSVYTAVDDYVRELSISIRIN